MGNGDTNASGQATIRALFSVDGCRAVVMGVTQVFSEVVPDQFFAAVLVTLPLFGGRHHIRRYRAIAPCGIWSENARDSGARARGLHGISVGREFGRPCRVDAADDLRTFARRSALVDALAGSLATDSKGALAEDAGRPGTRACLHSGRPNLQRGSRMSCLKTRSFLQVRRSHVPRTSSTPSAT